MRVILDLSCITGVYVATVWFLAPDMEAFANYFGNNLAYYFALVGVWFLVATDQRLFLSRRSEALVALLFSVVKAYFSAFLFTVFIIVLLMDSAPNKKFNFMDSSLGSHLSLLVRSDGIGWSVSAWAWA